MTSYKVELLDTETDEVLEYATVEAASFEEALQKAEIEAEYLGFFCGSVTVVSE